MAKINVASKDYVNEKVSEIVDFTGASDTENGKSGLVPAPNSGADNRYLRSNGVWSEIDPASSVSNGLLESADKVKLDGIETGANKTIVDSVLSDTSKNPVENNVINNALNSKANSSHTHTKSEITDFPTTLPADGGNSTTVNNHTVNSDVPENAVFTDTIYDDTEIKSDIANKVDKAEGYSLISSTDLAQISTNKDDILSLKGDGTGSINTMIDEKINAWATQLTDDGTVNTYAEAIQWIADHGSEYTALLGEVSNKVDKIAGKGLSTNDLTTALKSNYDTAYTHSQSDHARTDATKVEASTTNGNIKINGAETAVYTHPSGTNPHGTTKSDVGLGNVPNVTTNDQTPSYTEATSLTKLTSGEKLSVAFGKISKAITDLISHIGDSIKHITSTERTNWNSAKTHADSDHAPSNAQANVIEIVKVNGTALTPSSKAVNITVPSVGNGTITITQNGTTKGTFTTNQSGNTTIDLDEARLWRRAVVGQSLSTTTNPFYKFASVSLKNSYSDASITFKVSVCYGDKTTALGILTAHIRTNGSAYWDSSEFVWEYALSGIDASKFILVHNASVNPTVAELWVKIDTGYRYYHFDVISEGTRTTSENSLWTLYNKSSAGSEAEVTSGYVQQTSTLGTLKNSINGNAATATNADIATKLASSSSTTITIDSSAWTTNSAGGYMYTYTFPTPMPYKNFNFDVILSTDQSAAKLQLEAWSCIIADGDITQVYSESDGVTTSVTFYAFTTQPSVALTVGVQGES